MQVRFLLAGPYDKRASRPFTHWVIHSLFESKQPLNDSGSENGLRSTPPSLASPSMQPSFLCLCF